jgi:heme-degrading monooxygenase HmoA
MIQLHGDLSVDPSREDDMLRYFETVYRPAAQKFPGYVDLRLLKLKTAVAGSVPAGLDYRFSITYETEELRQKWVASDVHTTVWGTIEKYFTSKNYNFLLFEVI